MDINRFTEKAQEALQNAQRLAARSGQQYVEVEHLLAALLDQEPGLASSILRKANINLDGLKRRASRKWSDCRASPAAAASRSAVASTAC